MPNEVPNKEIKEVAFGAAFSPRFQLLDLWVKLQIEFFMITNIFPLICFRKYHQTIQLKGDYIILKTTIALC